MEPANKVESAEERLNRLLMSRRARFHRYYEKHRDTINQKSKEYQSRKRAEKKALKEMAALSVA